MSEGAATSSNNLPRPVLKGRHAAFMKRHLIGAIAFGFFGVAVTKVLVNDKRKLAYAEYYKYVWRGH